MPSSIVELSPEQVLEDQLGEVQCELNGVGNACRARGPHAADWYGLEPCEHVVAVCSQGRRTCRELDGWWCRFHWHEWGTIRWEPIPK